MPIHGPCMDFVRSNSYNIPVHDRPLMGTCLLHYSIMTVSLDVRVLYLSMNYLWKYTLPTHFPLPSGYLWHLRIQTKRRKSKGVCPWSCVLSGGAALHVLHTN